MIKLLVLLAVVIVTGCTASTAYDIDEECWIAAGVPTFETEVIDDAFVMTCFAPKYFELKCRHETLQRIDGAYMCTSQGGMTIRVKKVQPPESMTE